MRHAMQLVSCALPSRETPGSAGPSLATSTDRSPADASIVRFSRVHKTYDGNRHVVADLNLDVRNGEFLTLLGPSGSGKTSTLMMLAGFEPVSAGQILLNGKAINHLPPSKRGIGMVFQNYALFPHMTVKENILFPLEVRKMPRADSDRRVASMIDLMKLNGFENRRPAQLSGGQQQRVALARALVFEPSLVLLDEPLGALDKQLREHLQYEIKQIHQSLGVTMVYVTHDQSEALTMSDRIAVFAGGRIQQLAPPRTVYHEPATNFVASFIGENNQLRGTVVSVSPQGLVARLRDGSTIHAQGVDKVKVGDGVNLWVRPESAVIAPQPGSAENELTGRYRETVFIGDHLRVVVDVGGCDNFVLKLRGPAGAPPVSDHGPVRIGFAREHCRAIRADDE